MSRNFQLFYVNAKLFKKKRFSIEPLMEIRTGNFAKIFFCIRVQGPFLACDKGIYRIHRRFHSGRNGAKFHFNTKYCKIAVYELLRFMCYLQVVYTCTTCSHIYMINCSLPKDMAITKIYMTTLRHKMMLNSSSKYTTRKTQSTIIVKRQFI